MDSQSSKFKMRLGLFVAGGFVIFIIVIFLIGRQKNLFNPVFVITTNFNNVSGLQVGNNVRFSGINVGTVDGITIINDSTVKVDMVIQKEVQSFIKTNSEVSLGSEGIIGDRVVIISQGDAESTSAKSGQKLTSIEAVELDDIIISLHVTAKNAEIVTDQLAQIMVKINQGKGTIGRLIQDESIAENISQTIINLKHSTDGLEDNMEALKENFLFRGYFKRLEREAEKEAEMQKTDSLKLLK